MSNIIEAINRQKELERVAALNKAAAAGEKRLGKETGELLDAMARREQQRKLAEAKRQVETELYRAEQSIRAKYGNAPDLPPASHPTDAQEAHRRGLLRDMLAKAMRKD